MNHLKKSSPPLSAKSAFENSRSGSKGRKAGSVLSLRLTVAERDKLQREAAGQSLSAYVREKVFGRGRKSRRGGPTADHQALSRVLGALGRSPQTGTLKGVLCACDEGGIVLRPEAEEALRFTCGRIDQMRDDLIIALGLKVE